MYLTRLDIIDFIRNLEKKSFPDNKEEIKWNTYITWFKDIHYQKDNKKVIINFLLKYSIGEKKILKQSDFIVYKIIDYSDKLNVLIKQF